MSYKRILRSIAGGPGPKPLAGQVPNDAGGFVYEIGMWDKLDRFLILGSENGTYYVGPSTLTVRNLGTIDACLQADGRRTVGRIANISASGRAPKNEPALIALARAAAADDVTVRRAALDALPKVARTGTHLLHFADYVESMRGWGRSLRRSVGDWFLNQPVDRLALQAVKYRQRDGWSLRDLLRLAHPEPADPAAKAVIDWIAHPDDPQALSRARAQVPILEGFARIRETAQAEDVADAIVRYSLPREVVPTELLNDRSVWDALLVDMPMTAMIRNLAKMSAVGLLTPGSKAAGHVAGRLVDGEALTKARIHPIALLLALRTYARGRGVLGHQTWTPVPGIVDALDAGFEAAFGRVEGSGRRLLVAVDVSGSMIGCRAAGSPVLSAMEAAAAMAVQFVRTEPQVHVVSFDTTARPESLSRRQRLDDAVARFRKYGGGGTDVAQPILHALKQRIEVDAFVLLTDHETWAGRVHAQQALDDYRYGVNPKARIVCLATSATHGQVIDPADPLAFGAAGFDAAVPELTVDFLRS